MLLSDSVHYFANINSDFSNHIQFKLEYTYVLSMVAMATAPINVKRKGID